MSTGARVTPAEASVGVRRSAPALLQSLYRRRGDEGAYVVSIAISNVANLGFFVAVGRLFSLSNYGAIAAVLTVVTLTNVPLNAIQAGAVRARVDAARAGEERSLARVATRFAIGGALATVVVAGGSPLIEHFFALAGVLPVVMLALWFAPSVLNAALFGSLMGELRFRTVAEANVLGAFVRIGAVLALGGTHTFGDAGPVLATSLGVLATCLWVLVACRRETGWRVGAPLSVPIVRTCFVVVCLAGFSGFIAIDTALARHLLDPHDAGAYAAASTAGKMSLYVSFAVPVAFYPRFVLAHVSGKRPIRELVLALVAVAVLGAAGAAVLASVPHLVISVMFGHRYAGASSLVGLLALEGAALGIVGLLTYFHIAWRSAAALVPAAVTLAIAAIALSDGQRLTARGLALLVVCGSVIAAAVMGAAAAIELSARGAERLSAAE
jgi:O-antigen/teichoic acid export membrane protein